jgi:hypothetical protein
MGSNKEYLQGLKDVDPESHRLAEEVDREEKKQGIPHPEEETPGEFPKQE